MAMAATHLGPKRSGAALIVNAHAQVFDFPAGSESSSIGARPVFRKL